MLITDKFIKELYDLGENFVERNKRFVKKLGLETKVTYDNGVPQILPTKVKIPNPKGWVNPDNKPPREDGWTAEDYLKLVPDFEDKFGVPKLELHEGVMVVRDDLIPGNLGSKARYSAALMDDIKQKVILYAMVPQGQAGNVLAHTAQSFGKLIVLIAPLRKEPTPAHLAAMKRGAVMLYFKATAMSPVRKRCRDLITEDIGKDNGIYLAAGVKAPKITAGFIKSAKTIDYNPDIVISVASTMVMSHGLQLAFPEAKVYAVQVAGNSASKKWPGRAEIINHSDIQEFNDECLPEHKPPFPSVGTYDAKAWKYVREIKKENPDKKILFWNVAGDVDQKM